MRNVTIGIIAVAVAMAVLAGCDSADAPQGVPPGAPVVSVHGRVETNIGGSMR